MKALTSLPVQGLSSDAVLAFLRGESEKDASVWKTGKVSGTVYCGDEAHHALLNAAFALYSVANPLHPETWPRSLRLEAEVVRMTASLVRGSCSTVCGSTTSGGTESIILAIKAHRDLYRERYGITRPEVVCCSSAHAAVDKGCDLMGIRLVKVPLDAEHCASISHIKSAINSNTVLLYASAPSYPQGTIDAVAAMSALAQRFGVGLHVDCCLGGFVLPFAKKLGYSLPEFDFSLPGVTSMSLDTHKYGCALKGSSVVLYRSPDLRQFQYFCVGDWSGGLYTTPTIAGSRSTGLIAQTWASLVAMGEEGYLELTAGIMETTRAIAAGVRAIPGLRVLGRAEAMIVCFAGDRDSVNVYRVGDCMRRRGWTLNSLQDPAAVHLCVTSCHVGLVDSFLADLAASVVEATGSGSGSAGAEGGSGSAAVYGATASLPAGPINELLRVYNDVVLQV
jgi:glutamate/tyrosine decarboxylase-like PLP-dependent enzyme